MEDDQYSEDLDRSMRAHRAVVKLLDILTPLGPFDEEFGHARRAVDDLEGKVIPHLVRELDSEGVDRRLAASAVLLCFSDRYPGVPIAGADRHRSLEAVVACLSDDDLDLRMWCCFIFLQFETPSCVGSALQPLTTHPDEHLRQFARAAFFRVAQETRSLTTSLYRGLRSDDIAIVCVSALALAPRQRLPTHVHEHLMAQLSSFDHDRIRCGLIAATYLGPLAAQAEETIRALLDDDTADSSLRALVITALSEVVVDVQTIGVLLTESVATNDPALVQAAVAALVRRGNICTETVISLSERVAATDEATRIAAACGLSELYEHCAPAVPALLDCLGLGMTRDFRKAIVHALFRAGEPAFEGLIAIIESGDVARATLALEVFLESGPGGIRALVDAVEASPVDIEDGPWLMVGLLGVVRELGEEAALAVPTITTFLDESDVPEASLMALQALDATGSAAEHAIPAIVRQLHRGTAEVRARAERVLRNLGADAVDYLEHEIDNSDGEVGDLLKSSLTRVRREHDPRLAGIRRVVLESFVCVAEILEEHGAVSMSQAEIILKRRKAQGLIPAEQPISSRSLGEHITELEEALGRIPLTDRIPKRKGALTAEGRAILRDARAHLARESQRDTPAP